MNTDSNKHPLCNEFLGSINLLLINSPVKKKTILERLTFWHSVRTLIITHAGRVILHSHVCLANRNSTSNLA